MSLNSTPQADRLHIAFFGRRNAGKSSLVNAVTGQDLAIVSDQKGTTTDPVLKSMELLPLGPVVIIDTPGIDDEGALGELRVQRARRVLNKTDVAVLVVDLDASPNGALLADEEELAGIFKKKNIPFIIARNKCDLIPENQGQGAKGGGKTGDLPLPAVHSLSVSAKTGSNINELKEMIAAIVSGDEGKAPLVGDLVRPGDFTLLVIPIDKAAPKGRLILPQQQTIRGILDNGAVAIAVRESELAETLVSLGKKPAVVITDSQVFAEVSAAVPSDIPLTSFSILFARYKGFLNTAIHGVKALDTIRDNDKILITEGCTHHRQCEDIGTIKLPRWIREYTGVKPDFKFCSGVEFPEDLSGFRLVVHCGACMLNDREMQSRRLSAEDQNIPFTNYGTIIAHMKGILKRSIAMFDIDYE